MICPTCREVMIVVEQDKIELDHCPNCLGVWFDAGELELMLESMDLDSGALSLARATRLPEAKTAEKKRRCPICGKKMKKVHIGQEPEVLIDVCLRGDGLWFDGGEVHLIIEQCTRKPGAKAGSEERVLSFLGETFKAEG
jgi:Zn-finger nucleic acid-binding protein